MSIMPERGLGGEEVLMRIGPPRGAGVTGARAAAAIAASRPGAGGPRPVPAFAALGPARARPFRGVIARPRPTVLIVPEVHS
jgi:hypothetical protein